MHSPFSVFEAKASACPQAPFLIAPESAGLSYAPAGFRFTYGEVLETVESLRNKFDAADYGSGHRIALLLENRPDFFSHWLALNSLGISIVPINPDLRLAELEYQLSISDADLIVAYAKEAPALQGLSMPGVRIIKVGEAIPNAHTAATRKSARPGDECALLFTSGSTGQPKGCILSNSYFMTLANWYVMQGGMAEIDDDCEIALTPLPMFHMNALGCTALGMIVKGGAIVPLDRFHASRWWQSISDSGATIIHCLGVIPAILLRLPQTSYDTDHKVKFALGPGVDAQHKIDFETRYRIPIIEAWAMTETGGSAATTTARDTYEPGKRCVGRPCSGMDYLIVDDQDRPVQSGTTGELIVRAKGSDPRQGFFSGYLKDERATEEAWANGWFHTGDIVYEDSSGLLYFFDRKKSIVRRSGENIGVLEVEAALANDKNIKAVAVTPVPDDLRGEEVFAFLVRAESHEPSENKEIAESVVLDAALRLAYHKLPGYVAFIDALPLSSTQKLQRGEIKAMAADLVKAGKAIDFRELKATVRSRPRHD